MEAGKIFKASVAASAMLHAIALVALLFLAGSSLSGDRRQVFYVELKEARLVSSDRGKSAEAKTSPASRHAPQKKAVPEKKENKAEVKPAAPAPIMEKEPAPVSEAATWHEAPAMAESVPAEAVPAGGENFSTKTESVEAEDEGRMLDAGFENFALSSGPVTSRAELLAKIREAIEEELTYPPLARRRRIEGTVLAGFSIDERGVPRGIEIVESSGFSILDNEVIEIIRRAAPYPHVPERVEVPVSFRLVEGR